MAASICISIGLNAVNPNHYGGWGGQLNACENDARDLAEIARGRGFTPKLLLTDQATSVNVLSELSKAASSLAAGDILVLYYSGHGGQVGDVNGDEPDQLDETWCLFDRMLVDDELYLMWSKFRSGVRILVLSDSCHSGTITKADMYAEFALNPSLAKTYKTLPAAKPKSAPFQVAWAAYQAHKDVYDTVQYLGGASEDASISGSVLLISGCQDNQLSSDGDPNSLFTATLKTVWNGGKFKYGYRKFHQEIVALMPPFQTPNFYVVGAANVEFEAQQPFHP